MTADMTADHRSSLKDTKRSLPPVVKPNSSMADLVSRLDALVHMYAPGEAKTASPDVPTPVEQETCLSRPSPAIPAAIEEEPALSPPLPMAVQAEPSAVQEKQLEQLPDAAQLALVESRPRHRELPEELKTAKIMVVDDEKTNILAVQHHLKKEGYQHFITTTKSREAMELLRHQKPDVLLLDIRMPEISGLDILRAKGLDSSLEHVPVIILTAATDPATKRLALDLGATDFLTKPVDPNDLAPRVKNALVVKKHYDQKADEAARLEEVVRRRTAEVIQSREQLILSLARAAEHRDNETGNHVLRVGRFAGIIARELGWSESQVEMIERAAPLHNVGKIGVPDHILFKPGKLEPQEFDTIKKHCGWGKQIIEPYSNQESRVVQSHARLGESILHVRSSAMLMMASRIAQTHHEWWNGSGYPLGLAGEDIPLEGRIVAVADVYDALSTKRPYKDAFPRQKCFEILNGLRERQFDPRILDAFFARVHDIIAIQLELLDISPPEKSSE